MSALPPRAAGKPTLLDFAFGTPRLLADDTLPLGSAAIKADHFGVGSGLIHKHQLARIEAGLLGLPALTRLSDVGSILFGRVQNFF